MKSKKKMLLALGAMSAAAIGAGATSTFAWYQVGQANKLVGTELARGSYTVGTEMNASTSTQNAYLKLSVDLSNASLDLTTTDGQSKGVTNEGAQKWYTPASGKAYAPVSLTAQSTRGTAATAGSKYGWEWYTADPTGLSGSDLTAIRASDEFVANIKSAALDVKATAGSRVRLTVTNPAEAAASEATGVGSGLDGDALTAAKKFYTAFNGKVGASNVKVGELEVADGGAVTGNITFYYSIAGNPAVESNAASDFMKSADTISTYEDSIANNSAKLLITFALTITSANPA